MHADAADELTELDPKCAYIIGGIVDRNRYKGLCKTKAEAGGIRTARLPIGDYVKLLAAPVMTVNHVRRLLATRDCEICLRAYWGPYKAGCHCADYDPCRKLVHAALMQVKL